LGGNKKKNTAVLAIKKDGTLEKFRGAEKPRRPKKFHEKKGQVQTGQTGEKEAWQKRYQKRHTTVCPRKKGPNSGKHKKKNDECRVAKKLGQTTHRQGPVG